jgi:Bacterial SH3 domain/BON domain
MSIFDNVKEQASNLAEDMNPLLTLLKGAGLPINNLNVTNDNGNVTVSGDVEDGGVAAKAVEMLKGAAGVVGVTNNIKVADISAQNIQMVVATEHDNLNVRSGPGKDHEIIGKFAKGAVVKVLEKTDAEWYLVEADGLKGYCAADYLSSN